MTLPDPKHDTACFSDRRWSVGEEVFSTQEDARSAIRLAEWYSIKRERELADKMRAAIDAVSP